MIPSYVGASRQSVCYGNGCHGDVQLRRSFPVAVSNHGDGCASISISADHKSSSCGSGCIEFSGQRSYQAAVPGFPLFVQFKSHEFRQLGYVLRKLFPDPLVYRSFTSSGSLPPIDRFKCPMSPFLSLLSLFLELSISICHHPIQHHLSWSSSCSPPLHFSFDDRS